MVTINISKEFTNKPGARDYSDGNNSGLEFYEKLLRSRFIEALSKHTKLEIIMDGTEGFASSFINEAFGLLGNEFGADKVWSNLVIVSNEIPKYINKVKQGVYEKRN